jgi:hypothetical protein
MAGCGHVVSFQSDPKDRDPAGRLAKATGRPCKDCRAKAQAKKEAAERAARQERQ